MTTATVTKVKNGTVSLPKEARKLWKDAKVFVDVSGDTISIKRLRPPSRTLRSMAKEIQGVVKNSGITARDAEKAIRDVRAEKQRYYSAHARRTRH
jgi:hypothetical protein